MTAPAPVLSVGLGTGRAAEWGPESGAWLSGLRALGVGWEEVPCPLTLAPSPQAAPPTPHPRQSPRNLPGFSSSQLPPPQQPAGSADCLRRSWSDSGGRGARVTSPVQWRLGSSPGGRQGPAI